MVVWTGRGMPPSAVPTRTASPSETLCLGSQCQRRQQGQGAAASAWGDITPVPGFGSGAVWLGRAIHSTFACTFAMH